MVQLNIDASTPLKNLMTTAGADVSIYVNGELTTTGLPASFILIEPNGGIRTNAEKFVQASCMLSVSIYTKLMTTGAVNNTLESFKIAKFQSLFEDTITTISGQNSFTYELAANPVMYSGKSLISGYSTKIINVNCYIDY